MKISYLYTDASVKNTEYGLAGILVEGHHIKDIYYEKGFNKIKSTEGEYLAIINSLNYFQNKYPLKIIKVFSDCKQIINCVKLHQWVRAHTNRTSFKYKFNDLADYIAKNGLDNWKEYWYDKL